MTITTVTSKEFNQDVNKAKRVSLQGPAFISENGRPAYVLLTIQDYQKLTTTKKNIIDLISMPAAADIDFEPPKSRFSA